MDLYDSSAVHSELHFQAMYKGIDLLYRLALYRKRKSCCQATPEQIEPLNCFELRRCGSRGTGIGMSRFLARHLVNQRLRTPEENQERVFLETGCENKPARNKSRPQSSTKDREMSLPYAGTSSRRLGGERGAQGGGK